VEQAIRLLWRSGAAGAGQGELAAVAAQIFEQQDHLVVPILGPAGAGRASKLELRNLLSQLSAGTAIFSARFEDTGSQEFGDKLELIEGQAIEETAGLALGRTIRARSQRGNQSASH